MTHITEDHLEQAALDWFRALGYQVAFGPDIAPPPDGVAPERDNYRQTILMERLKTQLQIINPSIPPVAIDDAIHQLITPNLPTVIQINRQFHRWLRDGVNVQYQQNDETVGNQVFLVDFSNPSNNDWLVVNQFSIQGPTAHPPPGHHCFLKRAADCCTGA